jgi:molecular chaperone GrpE
MKAKKKPQKPEDPPVDTHTAETPEAQSEGMSVEEFLATVDEKLREQEDRYMRLRAEYDNYRRRTAADLDRRFADGIFHAAAALLPVYDNLTRAVRQPTADSAYAEGVALTLKGMVDCLAKINVSEHDALGQPFNAATMYAVMHIEDDALAPNTVVEVFEPGFLIGERVLRHAMVKVAN